MKKLNVCWWDSIGIWGDVLNQKLCHYISGLEINKVPTNDGSGIFRYYCIGSILHTPSSDNFEVWGNELLTKTYTILYKTT